MPSLISMDALHCAAPLQTLRSLIELSVGDADKLQLLGEAQGLLSAAPAGAYPAQASFTRFGTVHAALGLQAPLRLALPPSPSLAAAPTPDTHHLQELRWLVTTAWNRGAVHARFGRTAEAERYQRWAAGALQYHAPLEEQYQVPGALPVQWCLAVHLHCRLSTWLLAHGNNMKLTNARAIADACMHPVLAQALMQGELARTVAEGQRCGAAAGGLAGHQTAGVVS